MSESKTLTRDEILRALQTVEFDRADESLPRHPFSRLLSALLKACDQRDQSTRAMELPNDAIDKTIASDNQELLAILTGGDS
jgi:hypothetical protein